MRHKLNNYLPTPKEWTKFFIISRDLGLISLHEKNSQVLMRGPESYGLSPRANRVLLYFARHYWELPFKTISMFQNEILKKEIDADSIDAFEAIDEIFIERDSDNELVDKGRTKHDRRNIEDIAPIHRTNIKREFDNYLEGNHINEFKILFSLKFSDWKKKYITNTIEVGNFNEFEEMKNIKGFEHVYSLNGRGMLIYEIGNHLPKLFHQYISCNNRKLFNKKSSLINLGITIRKDRLSLWPSDFAKKENEQDKSILFFKLYYKECLTSQKKILGKDFELIHKMMNPASKLVLEYAFLLNILKNYERLRVIENKKTYTIKALASGENNYLKSNNNFLTLALIMRSINSDLENLNFIWENFISQKGSLKKEALEIQDLIYDYIPL